MWGPGMFAVLMDAYQNPANRAYVRAIFKKTWNMPAKLADAVLTGKHPYTVTEADEVLIEA